MELFENGFEIIENFISEDWRQTILTEMEAMDFSKEVSGVRNVNKKLNSVTQYLDSTEFKAASSFFIPADAQLVRAILFNKSPESNWYVTWHQDKTVAVSAKFDAPGWQTWSIKENILHVQPPIEVLKGMVTIRIHLDDAFKENGCLKVIPKSHTLGILSVKTISDMVTSEPLYFCEVKKLTALVMRPHLLHASSKSSVFDNRRVLHFEFSNWKLPDGICWG